MCPSFSIAGIQFADLAYASFLSFPMYASFPSQQSDNSKALLCPICRQPSLVMHASEMKVNFTLVELLEALAAAAPSSQATLCGDCNDIQAALFCENCDSPFCTPCFGSAHPSTSKAQQRHRTQSVADNSPSVLRRAARASPATSPTNRTS